MTWYHSSKHSKPNNIQKPIPTAQRDIFVRNLVTDSDFLSQIRSMFYLHVFSGKFLTSCRQMCVLCLRSRKRRKWRKKPWPPPVLPQWQHHLQSTRPAQGNTVRLSSLLTNYYVSVFPYHVITGVCGDSRLTVLLFCVCAVTFTQGGAIQLAGPGGEALQGVQALTLPSPATPQPGATILQYGAQPGDPGQQLLLTAGQMLVQGKTLQLINTFIVENTAFVSDFRQEEVKCIFQHVMIVIHFQHFSIFSMI